MATKLTPEQLDRIATMREAGKSCAVIARVLGVSKGAVSWRCIRLGVDPPTAKPIDPYRGPMSYSRGGVTVRRFTAEEDAQILQLTEQGVSRKRIAKLLGRKPHTVTTRLYLLARHEERACAR